MRIAAAHENGEVFQHFGHSKEFKIYEIEDGKIVDSKILGTAGVGHGALALGLNQLRVEAIICGGIGAGAKAALSSMDIKIIAGISGSADEAVEAFIAGKLEYSEEVTCTEEEDAGCAGSCGTCGSTTCGGR